MHFLKYPIIKKNKVDIKKYRELPFARHGSLSNSSHYAYFKVLEKLRVTRDYIFIANYAFSQIFFPLHAN